MGKKTIAEYVENEIIRSIITRMGVDYIQGYAIDIPAEISEVAGRLQQQTDERSSAFRARSWSRI